MQPSPASGGSVADRVAMVIATGFGTGYGPVAPGTWGSLPGLVAVWGFDRAGGPWTTAAATVIVSLAGIWAAGRAERLLGMKDPGRVVVDEVAGQMVTLLFLPVRPLTFLAGFLVFRVLDVVKPWPANRLESLPSGSGIMADDLMAGVYANVLVRGLVHWCPAWLGLQ